MKKFLLWLYKFASKIIHDWKAEFVRKQFTSNCVVGKNFSCHSFARCNNDTGKKDNIIIGNNCEINGILTAKFNGLIEIGDYTTIRYHSKLFAIERIQIGSFVIISNNVTIYDNNNHPTEPKKRQEMSESGFYGDLWEAKHSLSREIVIEDNVWIGERATILKGVRIGKGSIVAMGAVVTKNVPENSVVAGNPARIVKSIKG